MAAINSKSRILRSRRAFPNSPSDAPNVGGRPHFRGDMVGSGKSQLPLHLHTNYQPQSQATWLRGAAWLRKKSRNWKIYASIGVMLLFGLSHYSQRTNKKQSSLSNVHKNYNHHLSSPQITRESQPIAQVNQPLERRVIQENDFTLYDIAIVGSGPSGLSAAIFAARSGLNVIVLGSEAGGLLSETPHLDNYPGFTGLSGPDWLKEAKQQALRYGAKFTAPGILATTLEMTSTQQHSTNTKDNDQFTLTTTAQKGAIDHQIHSRAIILATGATSRKLGLAHEDSLWGQSLHSCAICDGHLYQGKKVLVVGGGDSAMDAAILLARYASQVYLVHRRRQFSGTNQAALQLLQKTENVDLFTPYSVKEWILDEGEKQLVAARLINAENESNTKVIQIDGAFEMIGAVPNTGWLTGLPLLRFSQDGLILQNGQTSTDLPGVFAAGEIVDNVYKQAITASSSGAQAAIDAERWLRSSYGVQRRKMETLDYKSLGVQQTIGKAKNLGNCDLTTETCIREIVRENRAVVFSKSWCPYCRKALEALALAGIEPLVVDLTQHEESQKIQSVLSDISGRRTVPNVFIGGKSIGGGDETVTLQAEGKLIMLFDDAKEFTPPLERTQDEKYLEEGGEDCSLLEQQCLQTIIGKYPMVMFSLQWCPECKRILEFLASIGAKPPHIVDLDDHKEIEQDIRSNLLKISGRQSVPNLFIGSENFGGFGKTMKLHDDGILIPKLREVGCLRE